MKRQHPTSRLSLLLWLGLILITALPAPAAAQEATIKEMVATNSESQVLFYCTIHHCFTDKIMTGIHNGIPATFTFYLELYQIRQAWPDRKIAAHTFSHTMTYDSLKEEYHVFLSEKNQETVTASLAQAQSLMAEANGFKVVALDALAPDQVYQVKVKAKLAKKTLPLNFHYLIPFSSLWDFETDWQFLNFRY